MLKHTLFTSREELKRLETTWHLSLQSLSLCYISRSFETHVTSLFPIWSVPTYVLLPSNIGLLQPKLSFLICFALEIVWRFPSLV